MNFLEEILNLIGLQANFDDKNRLILPQRGVPNPKIYSFQEPYVAKQHFDINNLSKYEKRVIAQLTDEESRLERFERILPPHKIQDYPEFKGLSYLTDLVAAWIEKNGK